MIETDDDFGNGDVDDASFADYSGSVAVRSKSSDSVCQSGADTDHSFGAPSMPVKDNVVFMRDPAFDDFVLRLGQEAPRFSFKDVPRKKVQLNDNDRATIAAIHDMRSQIDRLSAMQIKSLEK